MSVKCILQGQQTHQIALEDVITIDDGAHITTEESMGQGPYTLEFTQEEELDIHVSNENILHNWYFPDPINQKRQITYSQNSYTIDRWYTSSLSGNITSGIEFGTDGVKLTPGDTLTQPLEIEPFLINKEVTISALLSNGNLLTSSGIVQNGHLENIIHDIDSSDSKIQIDLYRWSEFFNNRLNFLISIASPNPTTSVSVVAVKLELGSVQTLAHKEGDTWVLNDPPPDKALELAKCQRYYREGMLNYIHIDGDVYAPDAREISVPMRVAPTFTLTNPKNIYGNAISNITLKNTYVDPSGKYFPTIEIITSTFPDYLGYDYTADANL